MYAQTYTPTVYKESISRACDVFFKMRYILWIMALLGICEVIKNAEIENILCYCCKT